MFKAGDLWVAVMPETFAAPRLGGELVPTLLRVDEFGQPFQLLPGMSPGQLCHAHQEGYRRNSGSYYDEQEKSKEVRKRRQEFSKKMQIIPANAGQLELWKKVTRSWVRQ